MEGTRIRRLAGWLMLLSLLFGLVIARLAWLQLGAGNLLAAGAEMAREAASQRSDGLTIDTGRGQFTDRYGRPLTGVPALSMAAFPSGGMPRGLQGPMAEAANALGVSAPALEAWLRGLKTPAVWRDPATRRAVSLTETQAAAVRRAGLLGVAVLPYRERYPAGAPALHAIGYVSQHPERLAVTYPRKLAQGKLRPSDAIGGAGLEKSLDRMIRGAGPTIVRQVTDAARRPLDGLGLRTSAPGNPHFPLQVRTTLDTRIQRAVEQTLREAGVRQGAAVVLDAANADIRAMVSLPALDPYRIGRPGTDARNRAITAYAPGSVFKIVTLAAALESGTADFGTTYRCDGEYARYGLRCWRPGGHGELTLKEAFAESCNPAFAALAERMDPAWIQVTAERLGLGRRVGWHADAAVDGQPLRLLGEEQAGAIFPSREAAEDGGVRAGTAIGQRDVSVTPLQAANLAVTLLHGGRVLAPRLVSEIRYADGDKLAALPPRTSPSPRGAIDRETAAAVLEAMRAVVTDGTARSALRDASWPLAGKSGTAEQAGTQKGRNDHWFVGYGPAEGIPRYAVAILVQDQPAGARNRATALFGQVMSRLKAIEETVTPPPASSAQTNRPDAA